MSEEVIPFSAWDPEAVLASLAVEVDREGGDMNLIESWTNQSWDLTNMQWEDVYA